MLPLPMPNYRRIFRNGHSYFLTVVPHQRNPILIDNIELLRESFRVSKVNYVYTIEAIVVLPDHIHMMITLDNAKLYPKIIRSIKQYFSKYCDVSYYQDLEQSQSRHREGYLPVWQKRYYEHTIRNEKEFQQALQYMYENPQKHGWVENANDWQYSSFYTLKM
jgi:putative transposase